MAQVRVSKSTFERLVLLKRGMDTFDDVIQRLLRPAEDYQRILEDFKKANQGKGD